MESLDVRVKALEEQCHELKSDVTNLKINSAEAKVYQRQNSQMVEDLKAAYTGLIQQISELCAKLDIYVTKMDQQESKLSQASTEIQTLKYKDATTAHKIVTTVADTLLKLAIPAVVVAVAAMYLNT